MTRIVLAGQRLACGESLVGGEAARHAHVARVGPGERIELLDLDGTVAIGRLLGWQGKSCRVEIERLERERGEPPAPLVLALSLLHTAAFDWAVEKATELGVTEILPVMTARVQGGRHEARVERWRRIAAAAVAQCGRSRAPRVATPLSLGDVLERAVGLRFLAEQGEAAVESGEASAAGVTLLVGPEGGFTADEVEQALKAGLARLPLGPRILRAETAAVTGLALIQRLLAWPGWR